MDIKLLFLLLIPGNIESLLYITTCQGNIAIHGAFLDIYYKRNLLYLSLIILLPCYLYNYIWYSIIFIIYTSYKFLISYNRYSFLL